MEKEAGLQSKTFFDSLCKCMDGQVPEQNLTLAKLLVTAKDILELKAMIIYILKEHGPRQRENHLFTLSKEKRISPMSSDFFAKSLVISHLQILPISFS